MSQEDFERELQHIPVAGVKMILEAVDALPPSRAPDEISNDGTVVNRAYREQEATPDSSPNRSSPGDATALFRRLTNMDDDNEDEEETTATTGTVNRRQKDLHVEAKKFLNKYGPLVLRRLAKTNQELDANFETATSRQRAEYQGNEVD
ncbi:hypothetical protein HK100_000222, partial [Physocladia obscura]